MANIESDSGEMKKQELDDLIKCCICTEVYTDPKSLPCLHTFCMKCLQETGLTTNKGPGDEMPCPLCRRLFKIPSEGFHGLPKNLFIDSLLQMTYVSYQSTSSKVLCDACLEENKDAGRDIRAADKFCVDCKQKYCEECSKHHSKFKLTKDHKLIDINECDSGLSTYGAQSVCELHERRILDVYCADCRTVVCAICFIHGHKHHEGSHVSKCVNDFRKQIEQNIHATNECRSKAQTKQREFLEVKKDIQERLVKLECDVTKRTEELKNIIDKHATSILQDLCSIKQNKLKQIQITTDDVETYISCLETYNSYCQRIMAKGSASDICSAFSNLSSRAMELQQECLPLTGREVQSINLCFRKSELYEFLHKNCDNLIGIIEDNQEMSLNLQNKRKQELSYNEKLMMVLTKEKQRLLAELRCISEPVLVHTIITNSGKKKKWFGTAEENNCIGGLAILDIELFVIGEGISEIEVYDSIKFNICRRCNLKELIYPRDMASCKINQCLYIYDSKSFDQPKEILRVNPNGKLITKWSTGVNQGRIALSATGEANVVLSVYVEHKVKEYSADGLLIREVNLYSVAGHPHPHHAMKLANGDFLVCCPRLEHDQHTLCTVDADGKLKRSFDGKCGSTFAQLKYPFYLSVDGNACSFVMVADTMNCRVLLLDSDLQFKREILSKESHGLRRPTKILLDESNGRLFVADNELNNQRILIFDFK